MSDRLFGVFGLALGAFYIWAASIIPDSFMTDVVGPRAFPYIVGAVILICSFVFVIKPDSEPDWPSLHGFAEIVFAGAVMLLYGWALPELGFLISTIFATAYLTWRLGTHPLWSLVVGVLTSVGIYIVFKLILGLSLASGLLGL
ncbi:Tripartite tricarboxylate transporter TctB family protein [Roseovarius sp. THAF27]|uniref:tripartite tricarboxylate transporter TctB family protein n=1 Tax=Roseovarius sp. THAF27 TaxID=2587850 RepID=UPI001268C2A4|nr:tripartite tricarboxylate transporter TctB family protein [Roseovarius sp. THAF27]QFT82000.1 Tripartite tricarboxylate transporter TctB family protein [Roseovarius sp. THAF27]